MDASGNLYQYDNYDEVAMDTDSEAGSPSKGRGLLAVVRFTFPACNLCPLPHAASAVAHARPAARGPRRMSPGPLWTGTCPSSPFWTFSRPNGVFFLHRVIPVRQDFSQAFLSTLSTGPLPPPPIPPPPDLSEVPPKPPFADEEEEEEMLLRETCLMSMVSKRVAVTEVCCRTSACAVGPCPTPSLPVFVPVRRRRAGVLLDLQARSPPQHPSPQPVGT